MIFPLYTFYPHTFYLHHNLYYLHKSHVPADILQFSFVVHTPLVVTWYNYWGQTDVYSYWNLRIYCAWSKRRFLLSQVILYFFIFQNLISN
jgi:hypothetical protein